MLQFHCTVITYTASKLNTYNFHHFATVFNIHLYDTCNMYTKLSEGNKCKESINNNNNNNVQSSYIM